MGYRKLAWPSNNCRIAQVSNIVHEEDEQEQQQQQWSPGHLPLPLLVPLPAVRRPDTRAFRRALHDVRRSAPAKLMRVRYMQLP